MPDSRERRTHTRRDEPTEPLEKWVRGEISDDKYVELTGNVFDQFAGGANRDVEIALWREEGEKILAKFNYRGPRRDPVHRAVIHHDLPDGTWAMLNRYGKPWESHKP